MSRTGVVRRGRLAPLSWVVFIILVPAGYYAFHVLDKLHDVTSHDLRTLDTAARRLDAILHNAGETASSLARDFGFCDEFFERQSFLELEEPESCTELKGYPASELGTKLTYPDSGLSLTAQLEEEPGKSFSLNVNLGEILAELPLDEAFDLVVIADHTGKVVEQEGAAGLRLTSLEEFRSRGEEPWTIEALKRSTAQLDVQLFGGSYKLLSHPLQMPESFEAATENEHEASTWVLAGLVSSDKSLQRALALSPLLIVFLALLLVFGLLTWPFMKLFSLDRRERFRFADSYFLALSTLAILMLATVLLVDADSYLALKRGGRNSLEDLANTVSANLRSELGHLHRVLDDYDRGLCTLYSANSGSLDLQGLGTATSLLDCSDNTVRSNREQEDWREFTLLFPELSLRPAGSPGALHWRAPTFTSVFWMEPGEGRQFVKGTVRNLNTPRVRLKNREYFRAIQEDRAWKAWEEWKERSPAVTRGSQGEEKGGSSGFFVQSFLSKTTGERSAALSIRSCLTNHLEQLRENAGLDSEGSPGQKVVAAISSPMASVRDPVLAPGFGFAVIDANGDVVFHSDPRRTVEENLFEQVGDSRRLRSAVLSGTQQFIDTHYLGRDQTVYVRPLDGLPWSVVTFLDRELLSTTNLEVLAEAIIFGAGYFALLFMLPTLVYLVFVGKSARWLWPDKDEVDFYRDLAWLFGVLAAVFTIALRALSGMHCVAACVLLPLASVLPVWVHFADRGSLKDRAFVARFRQALRTLVRKSSASAGRQLTFTILLPVGVSILLCCCSDGIHRLLDPWVVISLLVIVGVGGIHLLLRHGQRRAWLHKLGQRLGKRMPSSFLGWHCAAAALFWVVFAVLPAYGFFRIAFESQQLALVKYENLSFARQLDQRMRILQDDLRQIDHGAEGRIVEARLELENEIAASYRPSMFRHDGSGQLRSKLDLDGLWTSRHLATYKPIYNETSENLRYMSASRSHNGSWEWKQPSPGTVLFTSEIFEKGLDTEAPHESQECLSLTSRLPVATPPLGLWAVVGFSLLALLLVAWVAHSAQNLFFARIGEEVKVVDPAKLVGLLEVSQAEGISEQDRGNVIALVGSPRVRQEILGRLMDRDRVDLSTTTDEAVGEPCTDDARRHKVVVICDHFEDRLDDPRVRAAKLRNLETLLSVSRRRVLLLSTIDPFERLLRLGSAPSEEGTDSSDQGLAARSDESRRWCDVLSDFVLLPVSWSKEEQADQAETTLEEIRVRLDEEPALQAQIEANETELGRTGRRQVMDLIVDADQGHHWPVWTSCSDDERLALVQLAQESFVNPKQARTVRRLLQRGVLVRDPVLRFKSRHFRAFVNLIHEPEDVTRWEESTRGPGWAQLRWALLSLLVVIALFLFTTQKGLFDTTLGFVSALAVGLPGLLQLVRVLNRFKASNSDR